ncbi:hypothetical protein IE4872_PD01347 (plasmid) [Rhizobium gallicum]|uniref:Uncharacterized protein n=1 Tax=Rhizobium gallicum TaxID=56730 RepID=A0A1L5NVG2_9HYPH|nr:hypothetical protein IE4872_PD01347 [Rhizobium gallicum]
MHRCLIPGFDMHCFLRAWRDALGDRPEDWLDGTGWCYRQGGSSHHRFPPTAMEVATIMEKQFEALQRHDYLEKRRAGEIEGGWPSLSRHR